MTERKKKKKQNLIIVNTGEGKGKTTAAMGTAFRTLAHGGRVAVVQFLKSPDDYRYGERKLADRWENFDLFTMGAGFTWKTQDRDLDIRTTLKTWEKCKEIVRTGDYDLIIWDEINYVIDYGFLAEQEVLDFLPEAHSVHLILTGRNATEKIMAAADLVTEMKNVKHPFREQGIKAQKGIEW